MDRTHKPRGNNPFWFMDVKGRVLSESRIISEADYLDGPYWEIRTQELLTQIYDTPGLTDAIVLAPEDWFDTHNWCAIYHGYLRLLVAYRQGIGNPEQLVHYLTGDFEERPILVELPEWIKVS